MYQYIPRKTQFKYLGLTINEHLNWDLYFSQLKKTQSWDWASGKNKTFYSKALIENPLLFII